MLRQRDQSPSETELFSHFRGQSRDRVRECSEDSPRRRTPGEAPPREGSEARDGPHSSRVPSARRGPRPRPRPAPAMNRNPRFVSRSRRAVGALLRSSARPAPAAVASAPARPAPGFPTMALAVLHAGIYMRAARYSRSRSRTRKSDLGPGSLTTLDSSLMHLGHIAYTY